MELRSRTRQQLRRVAISAALGALLVPATAGAADHSPTITKVTPKSVAVGETLTITGKYFRRGKAKNTVLFKRDGGKALFVKAGVSTTKKMQVVIPKTLEKYMAIKAGLPAPTRFRLRVLASKLGKAFTKAGASPIVGPEKPKDAAPGAGGPVNPDGDCDGDGIKNSVDTDDDNDLLPDTQEIALKLDPCNPDTDGDGVEDGYEYQSAMDLNDDNYQEANKVIPYPGKRPYPNPLYADADVDYDGDGLTLSEEQALWRYTYTVNHTATRTLSPLSYSDGLQYSMSAPQAGTDRRVPTMPTSAYLPPQIFRGWADANGYGVVNLHRITGTWSTSYDPSVRNNLDSVDLFDVDRSGGAPTLTSTYFSTPSTGNQLYSEKYAWDYDNDGFVSDDERDEDADGLTNYDEAHGRMVSAWWKSCYPSEQPYPIDYAGTSLTDADSDGDGILDGADDQDHDDVPNIMELSRNMAADVLPQAGCGSGATGNSANPRKGFVQPFNPCLPDIESRTCERHPSLAKLYPPFDAAYHEYLIFG
jgi:hypothetical protein